MPVLGAQRQQILNKGALCVSGTSAGAGSSVTVSYSHPFVDCHRENRAAPKWSNKFTDEENNSDNRTSKWVIYIPWDEKLSFLSFLQ